MKKHVFLMLSIISLVSLPGCLHKKQTPVITTTVEEKSKTKTISPEKEIVDLTANQENN